MSNAAGEMKTYKESLADLMPNEEKIVKIAVSDIFESNDRGIYPVTFKYINFGLKTSVNGTKYTLDLPGIEAIYKDCPNSGVENIAADRSTIAVYPNPAASGETITVTGVKDNGKVSVYTLAGALAAEVYGNGSGSVTLSTASLAAGVYLIQYNNETIKLIVK